MTPRSDSPEQFRQQGKYLARLLNDPQIMEMLGKQAAHITMLEGERREWADASMEWATKMEDQDKRIAELEAALKRLAHAAEKTATRFSCYDELYEEVTEARRALEHKP